ncbi:MAG: hypothetical protein JXX28_00765 [Deltaproteobacteria bacterium]|nr:hypothetical protein [Deltaproteobacteria bacterium]
MFKMLMPVAALLALSACYNEDKFADDLADAGCTWTVACYPDLYADVDACLADSTTTEETDTTDCTFDAAAAKDCVAAWEELACPAEGEMPSFPDCANVYTDCPVVEEAAE